MAHGLRSADFNREFSCLDPTSLQRLQGWYSHDSMISSDTVLQKAFIEGKQIFADTLCNHEKDKAWASAQGSIQDIVLAIRIVQDTYNDKRKSKAWKWLTQLSQRVNYYGTVLDVMVQHHPEYAALVWGTMKILFVGIENHEESVHQLSKALCRIADCLPRQELKQILYPSVHMQQAVANLYAKLIQFMVHTLSWYQQGRSRRMIGAIFKPFKLDFHDQLSEIHELSRTVDEIATTAAHAELRAVHIKLEDVHKELNLACLEIKHPGDVVSLEAKRAFQISSCTQSLSSRIHSDLLSQSTMIRTVQLNQIMSASFMRDIPSSGQSLKYCSTFARRQPQRVTLSNSVIDDLRGWSVDVDISYLIIETADPTYGKALLLNLLQQIQSAKRPIIWALRFANLLERDPCIEDILRILVLHALEINSNALALQEFPVTLACLRAASSQEEWLSILNRSLAGLEEVYIVIDPDLLRFSAEDNTCTATDVLLALRRNIDSTRLKVIVLSFGINKGYFTQHSATGSWKAIRTNNDQRQRIAKMKRQHFARVRKIRKS